MPDVAIVNQNVAATPSDYIVPALQLLDPAGHVMWTAVDPSSAVAAGGSADVSWFPGVKGSGSSSGTTTTFPWAYISQNGHTSCPGGGSTLLPGTAARFYTNDAGLYAVAADGFGNHGISIIGNGHFLSVMTVEPFGTPAAGSLYELTQTGGGAAAAFEWGPAAVLFPTGGIGDIGRVSEGLIVTVGGGVAPPTTATIGQINNSGAGAVSLSMVGHFVMQLDSDTTTIN